MGKESEIEWIYICVRLNHCARHLKRRQHCKSGIPQYKIKHTLKTNQNLSAGKVV